jgi:hypothetical protein
LPDNIGFLIRQISPAVYENVCAFYYILRVWFLLHPACVLSITSCNLTPNEKSNKNDMNNFYHVSNPLICIVIEDELIKIRTGEPAQKTLPSNNATISCTKTDTFSSRGHSAHPSSSGLNRSSLAYERRHFQFITKRYAFLWEGFTRIQISIGSTTATGCKKRDLLCPSKRSSLLFSIVIPTYAHASSKN